jgi:hypothetical protein
MLPMWYDEAGFLEGLQGSSARVYAAAAQVGGDVTLNRM